MLTIELKIIAFENKCKQIDQNLCSGIFDSPCFPNLFTCLDTKIFHIESGPLIDTQDLGLPTLHEVLQLALLSVSSGLLTVGAICSAVFKKKGAYAFFLFSLSWT